MKERPFYGVRKSRTKVNLYFIGMRGVYVCVCVCRSRKGRLVKSPFRSVVSIGSAAAKDRADGAAARVRWPATSCRCARWRRATRRSREWWSWARET